MQTRIKSEFITAYIDNRIDYLEHEGMNGAVDDDTIITVVYKEQYGGDNERIRLKDFIRTTLNKM